MGKQPRTVNAGIFFFLLLSLSLALKAPIFVSDKTKKVLLLLGKKCNYSAGSEIINLKE